MSNFKITAEDLTWLDDPVNDPQDHCLHGHAVAQIGERTVEYTCTVSATALYLLKTLTEDHAIGQDNQLLPCCGHFLIASEDLMNTTIIGCDYGEDWSVEHSGEQVILTLKDGYQVSVPIDEYRAEVYRFADKIEAYYNSCPPREDHTDEFKRNGYIAFWNEWHRRRNAVVIDQ